VGTDREAVVDPVTHELLAWVAFSTVDDAFMVYVVQLAGSSPRGRWLRGR